MQTESISTHDIEDLDADTFIPVEIFSCVTPRPRSQDSISVVELGKQLLINAKTGDIETVRELMSRGAPFSTDWLGTSALHLAAQYNHKDIAEILLRAGMSRDAKTKVDRTPLHMAVYEGHYQMVQLLLYHGAEVDSRDMLKMTPLHWAVEREHVRIIHILLEHGADPGAISKFGKTPVSLALEHDRLDLVDILQQEREIIGIKSHQQSEANSAELEAATHNLMQLEADEIKDKLESLQQLSSSKQKLTQVQGETKSKVIFQQIRVPSGSEQEKEINNIEMIDANDTVNSKKHKDITSIGNVNKQFRLLETHGITMIPVDHESSIVENAMESGRTVVLTEAGKLALNSTRGSFNIRRIQVSPRKGTARKVIAIKANQIVSPNLPTVTSRAPNILKRSSIDSKAGKVLITTIPNTTTLSAVNESNNSFSSSENKTVTSTKIAEPIIFKLNDEIEEVTEEDNLENPKTVTDIAELTRQLIETQRQAAEYFKQYKKKEKEVEIYRQQIKNLTSQKNI
ncbi:GA-binding protein subunit beta-2 [Odontomachus brunneus]|uniref:GA-binding protein subunit beta-2 n=1 Tax=Odontomachus brunneus TaxID=486640 RepID=UPI0013F1951C|nr:GA-binding protein subunit beta-2 [Odontomachus brunneus]XP_032682303.1 GA-binding protein subunit beta-2 [Odontomachus brunneus]XP_032682304.1 GA-binding protein subunit beta-2 [Odontomachus brunneus]XP_032682305.1 GA-binding protein subunit beta-2 [Odontomachus brunneus]XP_032682306.1 GA-binding protein subunit beta-2 [Odontomachus brunneus]XP_032682307.1 GA-binding protein subunit beta-2 [Odontomachus brunneus]